MAYPESHVDPAFQRAEETVLPALALSLDTLIETAAMAVPGRDADVHAEALRGLAIQLEYLLGQIEAASTLAVVREPYCAVA